MSTLSIIGLHHIQLAMPKGQEACARAFYIDVLGLSEVAKPAALRGRGGVWFANDSIALHLGVENPFIPAKKAHPAFEVPDLTAAQHALAVYHPTEISTLPGIRRFYISDPFGNRIEILQLDDS